MTRSGSSKRLPLTPGARKRSRNALASKPSGCRRPAGRKLGTATGEDAPVTARHHTFSPIGVGAGNPLEHTDQQPSGLSLHI